MPKRKAESPRWKGKPYLEDFSTEGLLEALLEAEAEAMEPTEEELDIAFEQAMREQKRKGKEPLYPEFEMTDRDREWIERRRREKRQQAYHPYRKRH